MKLLKLSAEWCQPCKALAKTISESNLPITVEEVDIDERPDVAAKHMVRGVPTLILLNDAGDVLKRHTGAMNKAQLLEFIKA